MSPLCPDRTRGDESPTIDSQSTGGEAFGGPYHARMVKLRMEGSWPGSVVLRRGWSRAESRPWNQVVPMAHLRLVRGGGPSFIDDCFDTLAELGIDAVMSPPLPTSAQSTWQQAGFDLFAHLTLMRRPLDQIPPPNHIVLNGSTEDIPEALRIDGTAFDEFWRFDRRALEEAMAATPRSELHVVRNTEDGLAGFAITGTGRSVAYLQRLAVDPRWQGQGIGRSLIRTASRWAKRAGAGSIMLNTQTDNLGAVTLYEQEGFEILTEPLGVLRRAA